MEFAVHINGAPLARAECQALVERLATQAVPKDPNDVLRIARYSFSDKPEGIQDWARAEVFDYLRDRLSRFDPVLRGRVQSIVLAGLTDDIRTAERRFDFAPPATIGEATQLAFFGGDSDSLKRFYNIIYPPAQFPKSFYNAFAFDLNTVLREAARIPRDEKFLEALTYVGKASHEVGRVHLEDVTKDDDEDRRVPFWGRAAQFGSPQVPYGMKPDFAPHDKWVLASVNSVFSRKCVHVKIAEIAEACGIAVVPPEAPAEEWYVNLKPPFFHRRIIEAPSSSVPTVPNAKLPENP